MDYEKLMLKIKNKYFPELKDVNIRVIPIGKFRMKICKMIYGFEPLLLASKNVIRYNKSNIKKYNNQLLSAVFAHELAHILQEKRLSWFNKIISFLKYYCSFVTYKSISYKSKYEKEADCIAIKRGFGKGLIMHRKSWKKLSDKERINREKIYYSVEDLEKIVKKK